MASNIQGRRRLDLDGRVHDAATQFLHDTTKRVFGLRHAPFLCRTNNVGALLILGTAKMTHQLTVECSVENGSCVVAMFELGVRGMQFRARGTVVVPVAGAPYYSRMQHAQFSEKLSAEFAKFFQFLHARGFAVTPSGMVKPIA